MDENYKQKQSKATVLCKKIRFLKVFYTDPNCFFDVLPDSSTFKQCVKCKLRYVCMEKRFVCPKPSMCMDVFSLHCFELFWL